MKRQAWMACATATAILLGQACGSGSSKRVDGGGAGDAGHDVGGAAGRDGAAIDAQEDAAGTHDGAAGASGASGGAAGSTTVNDGGAAGDGGGTSNHDGGTAGAGGSTIGGSVICFPPAAGVPGQMTAPNWWTSPTPFDDPRWSGSYGYGYGHPSVAFDALVSGSPQPTDLELRWHVTGDVGIAAAGDQLWVGFHTGDGTSTAFEITRDALTTTAAGHVGAGVMSVSALRKNGALWGDVTVPTSISADARLDVTCTTDDPITCSDWVIRLHVPMKASAGGLDLGSSFQMWFEVDIENGNDATVARAKWPTGALSVDPTADPLVIPDPAGGTSPASASWFSVAAAGSTCAPGIALQAADVTVTNGLGAGTTIAVDGPNTFHVRPTNDTTTVYNPDSIEARLRIADWKASVGDAPTWIPLPSASCAVATGTGAPASVTAAGRFDLTCTWSLTPGQQCAYRPDLAPGCTPDPGPRFSHQCILVELLSNGAPIPFLSSSACNTFDFAASATP